MRAFRNARRLTLLARRRIGEAITGYELRRALDRTTITLQQTLEVTNTGSWEWDLPTNTISWSENLGPIHGLPRGSEPPSYDAFLELIHAEDRSRVEGAVGAALTEGRGYEIELRLATPGAEPRWILAHASVLLDDSGKPIRILGLTRDVTERKRREQQAEHAVRLHQVTVGLAAAATTDDIAEVIISEGMPALAARTGVLGILDEPGELRFVRSAGYGNLFPERLSVDEPWPITAAVRERRLIQLRDVSERRAKYSVPDPIWASSGQGSLIAVPLMVEDRVLGALGFTREPTTPLSTEERLLIETLAKQAAQALDRANLVESDRRARVHAEALQRVTGAVADTTSVRAAAHVVAAQAQAVLEAAGVTVVVDRGGGKADVLASCGPIAEHALSEPVVDLGSGTVTAAAIASLSPIFVETMEDLARWPSSARVAGELGVGAIACIPLQIEARRGALSVVMPREQRFTASDRSFLELLARTCEQGLVRAELREAEASSRARADVLRELAATLSGTVALSDVGSAFLAHATDHLDAGSGSLMLASSDGKQLEARALGGSGATRDLWPHSLPVDGEYVIATAFRSAELISAHNRSELETRFAATAAQFGKAAQAAYACPLLVGGSAIGAFGLVFETERVLSEDDERLLVTMADLCAHAVERARLYENEHRIATRLQKAMLPGRPPHHPGLAVAGRYAAGAEALEIGGDWYDTFALPDDHVGLAVGDVVGQGIEAAAAMSRLRSALAAYAMEAPAPGDVIERLHSFTRAFGRLDFATASYADLHLATGELRYSSAGHPPMLLVTPDGEACWLDGGRTPPLCGAQSPGRSEARATLEPGSVLLLYSDGLVERRGEHISEGLRRLREAVVAMRGASVEEMCDRLVEMLRSPAKPDDVVVLLVRALTWAPFRLSFPARSEELGAVRRAARSWLSDRGLRDERRGDIVLALGEACANAVEHAYTADVSGDVTVEIEDTGEDIVLSVGDRGTWKTPSDDVNDRGRGANIMEVVASSVDVESGRDGTLVRMVFAGATAP